MSKEKTHSTLLSIRKDEATSCIKEAATQAFKVETEKESSVEESDGGDTELGYEDDDKAVVLPDEDEEAHQATDDDIIEVDNHLKSLLAASMTRKSPTPRKPQMKALMTRNQLVPEAVLYHMTLKSWWREELPKALWITSPFKLFKES